MEDTKLIATVNRGAKSCHETNVNNKKNRCYSPAFILSILDWI
ncbi:MAG: hypothetical protein ABIO82_02275 [Ginsengibacter sp.]